MIPVRHIHGAMRDQPDQKDQGNQRQDLAPWRERKEDTRLF